MPIYLLSIIIVVIGLFVLLIPLGVFLAFLGMPITGAALKVPVTPATSVMFLLYLAIIVFFAVRLILSAPVTSAENTGPIAILRRSWTLTSGHWWSLFGFLALFVVGAVIVLVAVGSAVGVAVG